MESAQENGTATCKESPVKSNDGRKRIWTGQSIYDSPETKRYRLSTVQEVQELTSKNQKLDAEIDRVEKEGYKVDELEDHVDLLHEYNDIKDICQTVIGRIAMLKRTPITELYQRFGISSDD